jgi:hypothetical protein
MIDTVRLFFPHECHPDLHSDWDLTTHTSDKIRADGHPAQTVGFTYLHRPTRLRARGRDQMIEWVETSLSRLLFGHNGRLITSQKEIDQAMLRLSRLLKQVGTQRTALRYFTRVDLVWQFRGDPNAFIIAHRNCRHRSIRKDAGSFDHNSLFWKGSNMRVSMYDKAREQTGKPGDVVRVEVQLRGQRLKTALGDGEKVTGLDLDLCYQAYRQILLGFTPPALPLIGTVAELLALGERHHWTAHGVPAFDLWARGKSARQVSRVRQQMAALRPEVHEIDWEALLPARSLPPIVDVDLGDASEDDQMEPAPKTHQQAQPPMQAKGGRL